MRLSLKSMPKWLCIPPAVALLLVLGPLSMKGSPTAGNPAALAPGVDPGTTPIAALEDTTRTGRSAPTLPRTPDMWQITSALVGVLLLGVGAVLVVRKLRGGAVPTRGAAPLAMLRQTLRLSSRQAIHAIEFDDRILLVGEHERGLVLLESGRLANAATDEAEVLARHARPVPVVGEDEDDGAVPKNLVIPRPPQRPAQRPARGSTPAATAAQRDVGLNDFRTLLQKVGRA